MRSRKRIVMWSEREFDASLISFTLETALQVKVEKCFTRAHFYEALEVEPEEIYLVILVDCGDHARTRTCAEIANKAPIMSQVLVLARIKEETLPEISGASMIMYAGNNHAKIIDQVRTMLYRKRGPRADHGVFPKQVYPPSHTQESTGAKVTA